MSAPRTFDAPRYVADMRKAGARLYPFVETWRRLFGIRPGESGGIGIGIARVADRWAAATRTHPDWIGAVHDVLVTEEASA